MLTLGVENFYLMDYEKYQEMVEEDESLKAADYDPRAAEDACDPDDIKFGCQSVGFKARSSSLSCGVAEVPESAREVVPELPEQIGGISAALKSINTYPRGDDGQTTEVNCGGDTDSELDVVTAPYCADDDEGMHYGWKEELGETDYNAALADGISTDERERFCPPNAALRIMQRKFEESRAHKYKCARLVCGGALCGPGAWDKCPGYKGEIAKCAVEIADGSFEIQVAEEDCTLEEFSTSLKESGAAMDAAVRAMMEKSASFLPDISTDLRSLINNQMVFPFMSLMEGDTLNCGFMSDAWMSFLEGSCYEIGGAILTYRLVITVQAFLSSLMTICLFILWRHFIDTRKVALKEGKA
jgi:hypothetical protein